MTTGSMPQRLLAALLAVVLLPMVTVGCGAPVPLAVPGEVRALSGAPSAGAPAGAPAGADIVLVLLDDMTEADWRSLPKTRARLPAVFPNYITTDPLCCPSRATILTGKYAHSHGTLRVAQDGQGGRQSFRDQEGATIAVDLSNAGYVTGLFGKYVNGYPGTGGVPPGWNAWFVQLDDAHRYYGWRAVDGAQVRTYGKGERDYSTDVIARRAAGFVENAPHSQPLFAYVAPLAPHGPATPPERYADTCKNVRLVAQGKPSFNEADVSDKPAHVQRLPPKKAKALRRFERDRQCSLKAVDDLVLDLVAALQGRGRPFNLVSATDNGFLLGEHRHKEKDLPYEENIRTTMRAVGPSFQPGTDGRLVGNIDLAPTFAAIAGVPARADWDGRSLLPGSGLNRRMIGIEWFGGDPDDIAPAYRGFRARDGTVYVEYDTGEVELYDLNADPYQLSNLAAGKGRQDFPEHHARTAALRDCRAEDCWAAEDAPLGEAVGGNGDGSARRANRR